MTRTILITGCSTGIGKAAALGMKARGWRVFATARKPADIEALAAAGLDVLYLDYMEPASIAAAVDKVFSATGGTLGALFNNGAYAQPGALEDITTDVLRAQFEANFFGWHDLTRRVIPAMRRKGEGRIVMCSSVLGLIAMGFRGPYTAAKFALEAYTDTLRIELVGSGIHVSAIEPGPIRTEFTRDRARLWTQERRHRRLGPCRLLPPPLRRDGKGRQHVRRAWAGGGAEGARARLRRQEPAPAIFRHPPDLRDEPAAAHCHEAPAARLPGLGDEQGIGRAALPR